MQRTDLSRCPESKVYLSDSLLGRGHPRFGFLGRFRNGARSPRQHDLRRAAARGRYADALCRATPGAYRTGAGPCQGDIPQLYFDAVDRDKAQMQGVTLSDVFSTMMKAFTRFHLCRRLQYVSTAFTRGLFVYAEAEAPYRAYRDNAEPFLRTRLERNDDSCHIARNNRVPPPGPGTIKRFNMFNSATVTGEAAHGSGWVRP